MTTAWFRKHRQYPKTKYLDCFVDEDRLTIKFYHFYFYTFLPFSFAPYFLNPTEVKRNWKQDKKLVRGTYWIGCNLEHFLQTMQESECSSPSVCYWAKEAPWGRGTKKSSKSFFPKIAFFFSSSFFEQRNNVKLFSPCTKHKKEEDASIFFFCVCVKNKMLSTAKKRRKINFPIGFRGLYL